MNKTKISCILALTAIAIFIITVTFSEKGGGGLDGLKDLKWVLPLWIVMVIFVIVGFGFSIAAIIKERTILSWICFIAFSMTIFIPVITIVKMEWKSKKMREQIVITENDWKHDTYLLIIEETPNYIDYLSEIVRDETPDSGYSPYRIGKDDFFINFYGYRYAKTKQYAETLYRENGGRPKYGQKWLDYVMHVIPDNGGYKTELSELGHFSDLGDPVYKWFKNDTLCNKILEYYLAHQSEITIKTEPIH